MLKSSRYTVVFPSNGIAISGNLSFQPGITAVVGRNGTGKTFGTVEMTRYALFGKKALRGPASDYKTLDLEFEFSLKGKDYLVHRKPKGDKLFEDEDQIAVGAEAVNAKIVELLGFSMDVFDISNASVQKESSRLTRLTPGKRKELIDEVAGLTKNEKTEKDCRSEARVRKVEADTLATANIKPVKPVKPKGYQNPDDLKLVIKRAVETEDRRRDLNRIAQQTIKLMTGERPDPTALREHERQRIENKGQYDRLYAQLQAIPECHFTEQEILEGEAWAEYQAELKRRGPEPEIPLEEAKQDLAIWHKIFALEDLTKDVTCPKCDHTFQPAQTLPDRPSRSASVLGEQIRRHGMWETPLAVPKESPLDAEQVRVARVAFDRQGEREDILKKLGEIELLPSRAEELDLAYRALADWEVFDKTTAAVVAANDELATMPAPVDVSKLNQLLIDCSVYDSQSERYDKDLSVYEHNQKRIKSLREEADGFTKGAAALAETRREVKAYIAPAISRIASALLNDMTVGKLSDVKVDEDMNITVNGQDANTLSGAGESVANLALRLALGKVLVGSIFPVFLGDEIDADADEERSDAIFDALRRLKGQFAQVIFVTHKPHVDADHVIDFDA